MMQLDGIPAAALQLAFCSRTSTPNPNSPFQLPIPLLPLPNSYLLACLLAAYQRVGIIRPASQALASRVVPNHSSERLQFLIDCGHATAAISHTGYTYRVILTGFLSRSLNSLLPSQHQARHKKKTSLRSRLFTIHAQSIQSKWSCNT